jgi:organic hydroperoxide reductase OsmC/OhrA
MAGGEHEYELEVTWTGDAGEGTSNRGSYRRDHVIAAPGKPALLGSSDPAFSGDASRYNPEELLVAALSACHLLWYLHACAAARVVVVGYRDRPVGTMREEPGGSGYFTEVVLRPQVELVDARSIERARELHDVAHRSCFIARSVSFPVRHEPEIRTVDGGPTAK